MGGKMTAQLVVTSFALWRVMAAAPDIRKLKFLEREINPLTLGLNPSAQRCLTRFFYWEFCFLNRAFR
jgi:hypothetical protein